MARTVGRTRSRLTYLLSWTAYLLYLAVFALIITFFCAGTELVSDLTGLTSLGHPGLAAVNLPSLALVQFEGVVTRDQNHNDSSTQYLETSYWFLNSFGWSFPNSEETMSAGYLYNQPGKALQFPEVIHNLVPILNSSNYGLVCADGKIEFQDGTSCSVWVPATFLRTVDNAKPITLQTAPAFAFYIITLAGCFGLFLLDCIGQRIWTHVSRKRRPEKTNTRLDKLRFTWILATIVAHLIAALVATLQAHRFVQYLGKLNLTLNARYGSQVLLFIWLTLGLHVLASLLLLGKAVLQKSWDRNGGAVPTAIPPEGAKKLNS